MKKTTEKPSVLPGVLFCFPNSSSFVKKDIEILSRNFHVTSFEFLVKKKWKTPFLFLKQLAFILIHLRRIKIFICQLAGYHSLIPVLISKITGKPVLIFLGGTDCALFPSIKYGNFNKTLLKAATVYSVTHATHLAPKHETLINFSYEYDSIDYPKQGLAGLIPGFITPFTTIYNGYDSNRYKRKTNKLPLTFITVAAGLELPNTIELKGIDLILKVAPFFPKCIFTIVGVPDNFRLPESSDNIVTLPQQKHEDLELLYSSQQFYLQLSMSEGFPNAVCEAMLCECIPIVSSVNALPEIIGNTGYILTLRNAELLQALIQKAITEYSPDKGLKARERIASMYTMEIREQKLTALIKQLLS